MDNWTPLLIFGAIVVAAGLGYFFGTQGQARWGPLSINPSDASTATQKISIGQKVENFTLMVKERMPFNCARMIFMTESEKTFLVEVCPESVPEKINMTLQGDVYYYSINTDELSQEEMTKSFQVLGKIIKLIES